MSVPLQIGFPLSLAIVMELREYLFFVSPFYMGPLQGCFLLKCHCKSSISCLRGGFAVTKLRRRCGVKLVSPQEPPNIHKPQFMCVY